MRTPRVNAEWLDQLGAGSSVKLRSHGAVPLGLDAQLFLRRQNRPQRTIKMIFVYGVVKVMKVATVIWSGSPWSLTMYPL